MRSEGRQASPGAGFRAFSFYFFVVTQHGPETPAVSGHSAHSLTVTAILPLAAAAQNRLIQHLTEIPCLNIPYSIVAWQREIIHGDNVFLIAVTDRL